MRAYCRWILCLSLCLTAACGDDDDDDDAGSDAGPDGGGAGTGGGGHAGSSSDSGVHADSGTDSGISVDPVTRGDYLVNHVAACPDCHTPRKMDGSPDMAKFLSGVECLADADPTDSNVGCLHSRNLTNHKTGLKNRSDQEIKDLFLKGERPDGKALHPFMPYWVFGNMSDEDADAIVAYLRTVPGVDHMVPPSQPPFTAPDKPAPRFPEAKIPMPSSTYADQDAALRGRYLAGNIGICMECHTARNDMGAPLIDKAFQGGEEFSRDGLGLPPNFPEEIYSANITPDATGIKTWSVKDIVAAIKKGEDKDQGGAPLCPPMPAGPMGAFGGMTDQDATDIAHYLLSIPGGKNKIANDCIFMPLSESDGGSEDAGN